MKNARKKALKILAVDDDKETRESIRENLTIRYGHDVTIASSGTEALNIIEKHKFDLVLLDFFMPGLNGMQTYLRMRNSVKCPVVMMTAFADTGVTAEFMHSGGSAFLIKPLDFESFDSYLHAIIRQQKIEHIAAPPTEEKKSGTILLIDDDSCFKEAVMQSFGDKYNIQRTPRGDEGISFLFKQKADLVLLDYQLSGKMNGFYTYDLIRVNIPDHPPVIFVTFLASVKMTTEIMARGVEYVLEKPVSSEELRRVIEMVLNKKHAA